MERPFDLLYYQATNYPRTDCLNVKNLGNWQSFSTSEVIQKSENVAMGLYALGIKKGDKIAIVSSSRPEWNFVDLGIQMIGAVSVPLYPNITVTDYQYILRHAEVKMVFVENATLFYKVRAATKETPVDCCYSFEAFPECKHWQNLEAEGAKLSHAPLEKIKAKIKGEDLFSIIYTSGTTGLPKGVMLSYVNVASNVQAIAVRNPVTFGKARALSFLPLCHVYERTGFYFYLFAGIGMYYAESLDTIAENLQEVRPHTFNTVPRLLEKVYNKIESKGKSLGIVLRSIFFWALEIAKNYDPQTPKKGLDLLKFKLADRLIFSKWRKALGGNVEMISCGASSLQPRLVRIFWAANIRICEGYGLTETSPVITASIVEPALMRVGCAGTPVGDVEIKIEADGEICCKGKNVMMGYYKQPQKTAEVLKNGWFHTGDIGEILEGKYLKITDRKKEIFKTSGGKYVRPQVIENKFKESPYIAQISVVGSNERFPAALIIPNFEALNHWCETEGIALKKPEKLIEHQKIIVLFENEVERLNQHFARWEKIKKFILLTKPWSVEGGELTPTLKIKRRVIHKKHKQEIEKMYEVY